MAGERTTTTLKSDLIVPEVFGDIVTAKFKGKLVIANFALTDTTLVGNPGDTVHFPKWNPIGDAEDLEEDVAMVPEVLTSSDADATVKEVGKAVVISDQALLSSIGDPLDEAGAQVGKVVARKIDADLISEAVTNCPAGRKILAADTQAFHLKVADAKGLWGDEAEEITVLLVHSKMYTALLKDPNFISADKYPAGVLITGAIGTLYGVPVMITDRVPYDKNTGVATSIMLERNALGYITKRAPIVETGRDILKRNTIITTNVHYAVKLINTDGIAVIEHSLAGGGPVFGVKKIEKSSAYVTAEATTVTTAGNTITIGGTIPYQTESILGHEPGNLYELKITLENVAKDTAAFKSVGSQTNTYAASDNWMDGDDFFYFVGKADKNQDIVITIDNDGNWTTTEDQVSYTIKIAEDAVLKGE